MEIERFGLGIRLDMLDQKIGGEEEKTLLGALLSVFSAEDLDELNLFAGKSTCPGDEERNIFLAVITGMRLNRAREVFSRLDSSAVIASLLSYEKSYLQNNTLMNIPAPQYLGRFSKTGQLLGGENPHEMKAEHVAASIKKRAAKKALLIAPPSDQADTGAFDGLTNELRTNFPGYIALRLPLSRGYGLAGAAACLLGGTAENKDGISCATIYGNTIFAELDRSVTADGAKNLVKTAFYEGVKKLYIAIDAPMLRDTLKWLDFRGDDGAGEILDLEISILTDEKNEDAFTAGGYKSVKIMPLGEGFLEAIRFESLIKKLAFVAGINDGSFDGIIENLRAVCEKQRIPFALESPNKNAATRRAENCFDKIKTQIGQTH